jgi:hypothetical protein
VTVQNCNLVAVAEMVSATAIFARRFRILVCLS